MDEGQAPGSVESIERAISAWALGPGAFRPLAARPAPSFGASSALAFACGAAAMAINLARAAAADPGFLTRFPPAMIAAVGLIALGMYELMVILLAALFYGLGLAFGGRGGFDRAMQAAAAVSVLAPAQMICGRFPLIWMLPTLLAAWVAAGALEGLFGARPAPARALCAALAAAAIGLQAAGRLLVDRARAAYEDARATVQAASQSAELARQMQSLQERTIVPPGAAPDAAAPERPGESGLDLLRGPGDGETASEPAPAALQQRVRTLNSGTAGMLDSIQALMADPAMTKDMSPQMRADMKELHDLMRNLSSGMSSGRPPDRAEYARSMARLQQLTMHLMSARTQSPAPPPPAEGQR